MKNKLCDSKVNHFFLWQTSFGNAFIYLTSGVFLSGLAMYMGASDLLIGYISVITNVCGILIIALASFLDRFKSRKKLTVALTVLSRFITFFIVLIPVIFPKELWIAVFIPTVIAAFTLQAQSTVVLNNWMIEFINGEKRGRYISLRQTVERSVTVILSLTGGYFMDKSGRGYTGFLILFLVALSMGIIETTILLFIPDAAGNITEKKTEFRDSFKIPVKNKKYRNFVLYVSVFYFLLYFSDSFITVYFMRYLEMSYQETTFMFLIMTLPQIVLLGFWGKISDKFGHKFVLRMSVYFFIGESIFIFLTSPDNYRFLIPISFFSSSIANSGFTISVFNRRYELMPKDNHIIYDNFFSAGIGTALILAPIAGNTVKNLLEKFNVNFIIHANIRVLFIFTSVGILLLQLLSAMQRSEKNIKLK